MSHRPTGSTRRVARSRRGAEKDWQLLLGVFLPSISIAPAIKSLIPFPIRLAARYLIANTLLYVQRYRADQAAFDPVDIIERMDLRRAANDPHMLYVAAELFFHGATFRPTEANLYAPCAERLAWKAIHLGYDDAVWTLKRNESELVKYPNGTPCDINALREMLD